MRLDSPCAGAVDQAGSGIGVGQRQSFLELGEPAEQHLRRRLADLDAQMARLAALRAEMVAMLDALPSPHCPPRHPEPGAHPRRGVIIMLELTVSCCCDDPECPPEECGSGCC
jgi:hypothetical protein